MDGSKTLDRAFIDLENTVERTLKEYADKIASLKGVIGALGDDKAYAIQREMIATSRAETAEAKLAGLVEQFERVRADLVTARKETEAIRAQRDKLAMLEMRRGVMGYSLDHRHAAQVVRDAISNPHLFATKGERRWLGWLSTSLDRLSYEAIRT